MKLKNLMKEFSQRFTSYLFKLKLWASKSTTNVQDVHVEAQVHLNRNNKQSVHAKGLLKYEGGGIIPSHCRVLQVLLWSITMPYPHVKHTVGIWQCMGVRLLQVLAGAGDVERHPHHLQSKLLGSLQQVPTALQGEAKGYTGLSRVSLGGQLQQQPRRDGATHETSIQATKNGILLNQCFPNFLSDQRQFLWPITDTAFSLIRVCEVKCRQQIKLCIWDEFLLCMRVQAGNLRQLCLIFTQKMFNVVLGSVLDVSLLLANAWQNDGFWWHAVLQHQAHLSLEKKKQVFCKLLLRV